MKSFHLPINSVSFGQVSTCLVRELVARGEQFRLANIGPCDLGTQGDEAELKPVIEDLNKRFQSEHIRKDSIFKLWHLAGSIESFSQRQSLLSFYELDSPTKLELNVVKNNNKVYFSSKETVELFRNFGCSNVEYLPLGFDKWNFEETGKSYFTDDRIVFNLTGKMEKRKHHAKTVRSWIKRFGNDPKYSLQCAIYNPFFKPEDNQAITKSLLGSNKYFNVSFLGFMQKNSIYNDFLNSGDIALAMSGGEGWGLPEFQSACLGKHIVALNASGYKGWVNEENSTLVSPSGKISAVDNIFFKQGDQVNQGNIYDFDEDEFIAACEKAIEKTKANRVNEAGKKLKDEFSYAKMLDKIIQDLD